jgi:hypothetical protein
MISKKTVKKYLYRNKIYARINYIQQCEKYINVFGFFMADCEVFHKIQISLKDIIKNN